jgi:hypothetical protein
LALPNIFTRVVHHWNELAADLALGHSVARRWLELAVLMAVGAAVYGFVLGWWHGPRLAGYVAAKLPAVLLLTAACTMFFSWIAARALGLPLRFPQVGAMTFLALSTASVLLASLAPIAWLFTVTAPPPTPDARTAHNLLYLMHTTLVGISGLAGTVTLWRALGATGAPVAKRAGAYALWLAAYAIVGGEVAWVLRPFVGSVSPEHPIVFLRPDALDGNVYEFVIRDIIPHLLAN